MDYIYNKIFLEHNTGNHAENFHRLEVIKKKPDSPLVSGEDYLPLVHTSAHIDLVKKIAESGGGRLDPDTIVSSRSYQAAIYAVGATIEAAATSGFALVRPPGHHAYASYGSGFCLFNNIAIAVQKLVMEGKRVLIFDFDGHYGNGTADIFYKTGKVLYWSIHQYPAYPGNGFVNEIGSGFGLGYNIAVPLPKASGDDIFKKAFETFLPVALEFQPDVVAVSAGFDAHYLDPLLSLRLTSGTFHWIGAQLAANFNNIFAVLEGGYNLECLPACVENLYRGVNQKREKREEKETETDLTIWDEYEERERSLKKALSIIWNF